MKAKAAITLRAGEVWTSIRRHRRIVAIGNGYVLYCTGGEKQRECKALSFLRWIARAEASCTFQSGGGGVAPSPHRIRHEHRHV